MIVLLNKSGQLGNRLRSLSAFVALGIENNEKMVCPVVEPGVSDYFVLKSDKYDLKMYYSSKWLFVSRCFEKAKKLIRKREMQVYNKKPKRIKVFTDWLSFAEPYLLYKHYDEIRGIFAFKQEVINKCQGILDNFEIGDRVTVAVHYRRGDYKVWRNGQYYFSENEFIMQMQSIKEQLGDVLFLIASNEKVTKELFANNGLEVKLICGTVIEDLCCMSMCDYIMGPPSTFSAWAGYIGNKKLLWMKEHNKSYTMENFRNVPDTFKGTYEFWNLE